MPKMKAAVFVEPGRIVSGQKPIFDVGRLDARLRVATTTITICGTDVHGLRGEYPASNGRFALDRSEEAYDLFVNQRDGSPEVAVSVKPGRST